MTAPARVARVSGPAASTRRAARAAVSYTAGGTASRSGADMGADPDWVSGTGGARHVRTAAVGGLAARQPHCLRYSGSCAPRMACGCRGTAEGPGAGCLLFRVLWLGRSAISRSHLRTNESCYPANIQNACASAKQTNVLPCPSGLPSCDRGIGIGYAASLFRYCSWQTFMQVRAWI